MTRKDYELIAAALNSLAGYSAALRAGPIQDGYEAARKDGARSIADAMQLDNARFDRTRFLAACGVTP